MKKMLGFVIAGAGVGALGLVVANIIKDNPRVPENPTVIEEEQVDSEIKEAISKIGDEVKANDVLLKSINILKTENEGLQRQLTLANNQIDNLNLEITSLKSEVNANEFIINKLNAEKAILKTKVNALQGNLGELQTKYENTVSMLKNLNVKADGLRKELEEHDAKSNLEILEITHELENTTNEEHKLEQVRDDLNAQIQALETQIETLTQERDEKDTRIQQLDIKNDILNLELLAKDQKLEQVTGQRDSLEYRYQEAQNMISELSKTIVGQTATIKELASENAQVKEAHSALLLQRAKLQTLLDSITQTNTSLEERVKEYTGTIKTQETDIAELEAEKASLEGEKAVLEAEKAVAQRNYDETVIELQHYIDNIKALTAASAQDKAELESQVQGLNMRLFEEQANIQRLELQKQNIQQSLDAVNAQNQATSSLNTQLQTRVNELTQQKELLIASYNSTFAQLEAKRNEVIKLEADLKLAEQTSAQEILRISGELKTEKENYQKLVEQHQSLQDAIDSGNALIMDLASKVKDGKLTNADLTKALEEANKQIAEFKETIAAQNTAANQLKDTIQLLKIKEASLSNQLASSKTENLDLQGQLNSAQTLISKLEKLNGNKDSDIAILKATLTEVNELLRSTSGELTSAQATNASNLEQIDLLKLNNENLQIDKEDLTGLNTKLQENVEGLNKQVAQLNGQVETRLEELAKSNLRISNLESEIAINTEKNTEAVNNLNSQLDAERETNVQLLNSKNLLEVQLNETKDLVTQYEKTIAEQKQDIAQLTSDKESYMNLFESTKQLSDQYYALITSQNQQIIDLKHKVTSQQDIADNLRKDVASLNGEVAHLNAMLNNSNLTVQKLERTLQLTKELDGQKLESILSRLDSEMIHYSELLSVKNKLEADNATLNTQVNNQVKEIEELNESITSLTIEKNTLSNKQRELLQKIADGEELATEITNKLVIANERIETLEGELATAQDTIQNLNEYIEIANKSIDSLKLERSLLEHKLATAKFTIADLEHDIELNEDLISQKQTLLDTRDREIKIAQTTILSLQDELKDIKQDIVEKDAAIAKERQQIAILQNDLSKLETNSQEKIDELKADLSRASAKLSSLSSEKQKLEISEAKLTSDVNRLESEVQHLLFRIDTLNDNIASLKKTNIVNQDKIKELTSKNEELTQDLENANAKIGELSKLIENKDTAIAALNKSNEEQQKRITELESSEGRLENLLSISLDTIYEYQAQQATLNNALAKANHKIASLRSENLELDDEISSMLLQHADLQKMYNVSQSNLEQSLTKIDSLREQMSKMEQDDKDVYQGLLSSYRDEVIHAERLANQNAQLDARIGILESQISTHEATIKANQATITLVTSERDALQTKVNTLTEKLEKEEAKTKDLESQIDTLKEEKATLQSIIDEKNEIIQKANEDIKRLETHNDEDDKKITDLESEITKLMSSVTDLNKETQSIAQQYADEMVKYNQAMADISGLEDTVKENEDKIALLDSSLRITEQQNQALLEQQTQVMHSLSRVSMNYKKAREQVMFLTEQIEALNSEAATDLAAHTARVAELNSQLNAANTAILTHKNEIMDLEQVKLDLQGQVSKLDAEKTELIKQNADYIKENQDLKNQLAETSKALTQQQNLVNDLNERLRSASESNLNLQQEVGRLRSELMTAQASVTSTQNQLKSADDAYAQLATSKAAADQKASDLQFRLDAMIAANSAIEAQNKEAATNLRQAIQLIDTLKMQLSDSQRLYENAASRVRDLESQLTQITSLQQEVQRLRSFSVSFNIDSTWVARQGWYAPAWKNITSTEARTYTQNNMINNMKTQIANKLGVSTSEVSFSFTLSQPAYDNMINSQRSLSFSNIRVTVRGIAYTVTCYTINTNNFTGY